MITNTNEVIEGVGYTIYENLIPIDLIDSITSKLNTLYPVRASSSNKQYAENNDIKNLPDISVWWSQSVMDWPEIILINNIIKQKVDALLNNSSWYSSDIVTISANSKWVNPHVDTPHRFKKFNYDKRFLGIQAICSLYDLDHSNGSTGIVPNSQHKDFNINLCYQGMYNSWFLKNCIQPTLPKGTILLYNSRLLHSSMPNPTNLDRPALLFNYLENSIINEIRSDDNIWKSNN
jgi:ectoine hydroxylase-related dioxygenase (phytanoyl-CoA dioxygenase family)